MSWCLIHPGLLSSTPQRTSGTRLDEIRWLSEEDLPPSSSPALHRAVRLLKGMAHALARQGLWPEEGEEGGRPALRVPRQCMLACYPGQGVRQPTRHHIPHSSSMLCSGREAMMPCACQSRRLRGGVVVCLLVWVLLAVVMVMVDDDDGKAYYVAHRDNVPREAQGAAREGGNDREVTCILYLNSPTPPAHHDHDDTAQQPDSSRQASQPARPHVMPGCLSLTPSLVFVWSAVRCGATWAHHGRTRRG